MSHGLQKAPHPDITLISLDDSSTKELDEFAPLPFGFHTRLLDILVQARPKAIGYLIDMNHVLELTPPTTVRQAEGKFLQSIHRLTQAGTVFVFGTPFDVTGEVLPPTFLQNIPHSIAVVHRDGNVFAEDQVTRRALLTLDHTPAFHLDLARRLGLTVNTELPKGNFYVPEVDGNYFFFKYHGNTVLNQKHHSADATYTHYSFSDVIHGRIDMNRFRNKIILIGTVSSDDSSDFAYTPYSKYSYSNPKLVVHANILDSIIQNDGIIRSSDSVNCVVTFLVTVIVLWWIMTLKPLYGLFATLILAFAFLIFSQILFQSRGIWLRESQPLIGIFVSYYLAVPYRLICEYKKRWEYQRRNQILTQVEELKANFISLITHDLKTPVARIQGLAELLLRSSFKNTNSVEHLTSSLSTGELSLFEGAIGTIIKSTEELNHFISSILELGHLESNHLELRKESRDINQLIELSVENFRTQADSRQIQILCQLEPLFAIQVDPSLMAKVFNNLIDNALKYSPKNSQIFIHSKEEGDWIVITVKDHGIGMTVHEQQRLFTKFYRIKNDLTLTTSGTGLGLYLSKYFVEAHRGRIEWLSTINQGSTFMVFLPIHERPHTLKLARAQKPWDLTHQLSRSTR
jgi:signal transduction histidine kinase